MSLSKSKLISSTPDYFACEVNNSANRLRELSGPVNQKTGNYGYLTVFGV